MGVGGGVRMTPGIKMITVMTVNRSAKMRLKFFTADLIFGREEFFTVSGRLIVGLEPHDIVATGRLFFDFIPT